MKWINRAVTLAALVTFSSVAAVAQDAACTEEYLNETYTKWYEPYKARDTDPKQKDLAYQIAKEYANKCPNEFPDNAYAKALKSYVKVYETAQSTGKLAADFDAAVKSKNYAEQIRLGKQVAALPANADNAVIYILIAAAANEMNSPGEASSAAKKAMELIEAGKPVTPAYQTKDQALAAMNYVLAKATMKTSATDSISYFVKALRFESDLKKDPRAYNELATAYGEGPVAKYAKEYQDAATAGKSVDSPEVKLIVANLNQALDRQIDAFARAAAVSSAPTVKKQFMEVLAAVYKDRNKKDAAEADLNTMVASALSTPVPDVPAPITTVPQSSGPAPVGTGAQSGNAAGSSMPGNNGNGTSSASTSATKPAATGNTTTPAKPTATPKPKQRR